MDVNDLHVTTLVNGVLRQHDSTALMKRNVAHPVQEISAQITLEPGDRVLTGSPGGSASGMPTPEFLSDGDTIVSSVTGLGRLHNTVKLLPRVSIRGRSDSGDTASAATTLDRHDP